jgi:hypothetical protein
VEYLSYGATSTKLAKGEAVHGDILSAILYLAPHTQADGKRNVCAFATRGCATACLYTAGRGGFTSVKRARIRKTKAFFADRRAFVDALVRDAHRVAKRAAKLGKTPAIRLNGTSDIPWHNVRGSDGLTVYEATEHLPIRWWDYTKDMDRAIQAASRRGIANGRLHLTYSASENTSDATIRDLVRQNVNVAVVFDTKRGHALPATLKCGTHYKSELRVKDGDVSDFRFRDGADGAGLVIGLRAKGDAKHDESGFVRAA